MSEENPDLEPGEDQVDLDLDPKLEEDLGEEDFQEFDYRDSYTDVDPNFVPLLQDDDSEDDDEDEELTEEEAEPPEEEVETVPYWASYELQGRNLDEGTAWQSLATEPYAGELEVEVEGLTAGARWEFRLRLLNGSGQFSKWSEPLQISLPTDFTPPPAPTPPDVDENNGYISSWWDGELTGQMPKDFSHIVKYLQQMHPEDDPEGEPGDPYRFSTLGDAGVFSVGFLLSGVLYRTWYTAVDTSGNESPWSDVVEFTPSSAFNTEELEEDLRKLNEERLPELEQSLTTKANEATQAVEAFRTEWDENWDPEAIDELRGRADATEAEVATAKAEAEQAKQDAAAAQANADALESRADATDAEVAAAKAEAEQARQDAEAAQAKANAVEAQASNLDTRIQEGLAEADTRIHRLAVTGSSGNLFSDPEFETFEDGSLHWWTSHRNGSWVVRDINELDSDLEGIPVLSMNNPSVGLEGDARAEFFSLGDRGIPCEGGQEYVFRCEIWPTNSAEVVVAMRFRDTRMGTQMRNVFGGRVTGGGRQWYEFRATAPEGYSELSIDFVSGGGSSGWANFFNPSLERRVHGSAVIDGTLLARHVDMEDFTADRGFIDNAFVRLIEGELANYDQGIIGDVLLKDGAVFARHVRLGHSGNMLKNAALEGPEGSRPDGFSNSSIHIIKGAGYSGGNAIRTPGTTSQTGGYFGNTSGNEEYRVTVEPGGSYKFTAWVKPEGADIPNGLARIYIRELALETGTSNQNTSMVASNDGVVPAGEWSKVEGIRVMRDDTTSVAFGMYIQPQYTDSLLWSNPSMVQVGDASMTIHGLLQATTAELNELFFDTAVGNAIAAGSGQFLELDADQIRSNSWTGQVMTGPVMQSHSANNTGWRIEPGQGLRMWDNSGAQTVRLDGTDNYFAGRLHAGMDTTRGVLMDYGTIGIMGGWNEEEDAPEVVRETDAPFIEFHTGHDYRGRPPIIWPSDETLGLDISPGRAVGSASGSGVLRVWGHVHANRLRSRNLEVPTTSDSQPGGLRRDGPRTRLHGRFPNTTHTHDMLSAGRAGSYQVTNYYRDRVYWASPPESGTRLPVLSMQIANNGMNSGYNTATVISAEHNVGSFRFNIIPSSNHGWNMWVHYVATWQ